MLFLSLIQTPAAPSSNPMFGFLPILLIFAVFYFLLFMPMQRQRKRQQKMLASLEAGAEVLTSGGIIGQIISIQDDTLILRVRPDGVKLQMARNAVASVIGAEKK